MKKNLLVILSALLVIYSCTDKVGKNIKEDELRAKIAILASDEFMGRAPATIGEEKTIEFMVSEFKRIGLEPANGDSYLQEVPLVKISADRKLAMNISGGEKGPFSLKSPEEIVGGTPQISGIADLKNSEMVFIGYGINAPEYNWDDYAGLEVKGKTVVMLVNDPGYATKDSALFTGNAMTIYGRWTYKFEEAARQGAAAAIIIHETGAASYPWGVVENSWRGKKFYLKDNEISKSPLLLQSWITTDAAQKLFSAAGLNLDSLSKEAAKPGFKPVYLNLKSSFNIRSDVEFATSHNIAAILPGKSKPDEVVIYSAHWDHFGVNNDFKGDSIINGAVDNATGVAAILEMAEEFVSLKKRPERSIMILSVTCEEQGLLGSEYYVQNPLIPLEKTKGVINIDGLNIFGKTKDMTITGLGKSPLDVYALDVLKNCGRYVRPDATPEKGSYFRSDHFSFAKLGVPTLYLSNGVDFEGKGAEWGIETFNNWVTENYHKPSDNYVAEEWNLEGMIEDIKIYFEIGLKIANSK